MLFSFYSYFHLFIVLIYPVGSSKTSATIIQPGNLEWIQVIDQASTFNVSTPITFSELIVESAAPVHTFGFILNVVHIGDIPEEDFEDLSASIRIFGDNAEVQTYQYAAKPEARGVPSPYLERLLRLAPQYLRELPWDNAYKYQEK